MAFAPKLPKYTIPTKEIGIVCYPDRKAVGIQFAVHWSPSATSINEHRHRAAYGTCDHDASWRKCGVRLVEPFAALFRNRCTRPLGDGIADVRVP